jgi:hypothetical protein
LDDTASVQDDDFIAVSNRTQPVRDNQAGASAATETVVDPTLGNGVEGTGGFVEDE